MRHKYCWTKVKTGSVCPMLKASLMPLDRFRHSQGTQQFGLGSSSPRRHEPYHLFVALQSIFLSTDILAEIQKCSRPHYLSLSGRSRTSYPPKKILRSKIKDVANFPNHLWPPKMSLVQFIFLSRKPWQKKR